jgi:hypothetical protein
VIGQIDSICGGRQALTHLWINGRGPLGGKERSRSVELLNAGQRPAAEIAWELGSDFHEVQKIPRSKPREEEWPLRRWTPWGQKDDEHYDEDSDRQKQSFLHRSVLKGRE